MSTVRSRIKSQHAEKVLASLDKLRAWEWEWSCDFTIQVGNESFPGHRTVLASCSKYFFDLFKRNGEEVKEGGIEITGLTATTVKLCIEFIYSGVADITLENVDHVLLASNTFKLDDLTELCLDFFSRNLSVENCLYVKLLYEKFGYIEKGTDLKKFVTENFYDLVSTKSFLTLKKDDVLSYLKAPNVDHKLLWKGVIAWINFRENERKKYYFEFLSLNSTKFPPEFLLVTVWPYHLTKESKPCKDLLISVLLSDPEKLESGISVENCFLLKKLCETWCHANSREAHCQIRLFMMKNFEKIADRDEIMDLSNDEIFQIFRSPKTRYSSEVTKWEVAIKWTKHILLQRKMFFADLLAAIKLENMSLNFIQEVVRPEPLVFESDKCNQLLMDALFTHARHEKSNASINTPPQKRTATEATTPKAAMLKSPRIAALSPTPPKKTKRTPKTNTSIKTPPRKRSAKEATTPKAAMLKSPRIAALSPTPQKKEKRTPKTNRKIQDKVLSEDAETINPEAVVSVSPAPPKKTKRTPKTNSKIQDKDLSGDAETINPEAVVSPSHNMCLAVYDSNSGKIKGLDLETVLWKDLAVTKVTKDEFQGITSVANKLFLLKGVGLFVLDGKNGWRKLATKPTKPNIGAKMEVFQNSIYIVQNGSLSHYDLHTNAWVENYPFISTGYGFCVCANDMYIFILGGSQNPTRARKYDPLSAAVSEIRPLINARQGAAAALLNDKVYIMGGAVDGQLSMTMERYDPEENLWTAVPNMQVQRSNFCACVYGGKIYAVGGSTSANKMDSVEDYEVGKDKHKWRILHRMLKLNSQVTACIVEMPRT